MNALAKPMIRNALIGVVLGVGMLAVAYFLDSGQSSGSKTVLAFAVMLAALPMAIYAALKRPLLFPFCIYVILVPFDQLLGFSKFGTITRLLAVLSGAAILFSVIRNRQWNAPPKTLGYWSLLLLWMAVTVFWAIDPQLALARVAIFAQLLVLYAALCLIPMRRAELNLVLAASALGGVAAATYGGYYFHNNLNTIMKRLILSNSEGDAIDPNHFAAALILPISIVTVAALTARSVWLKLCLIMVDLVLFAGVYESGSRGSVVAIGIVFAFLLFQLKKSRWQLAVVGGTALVASFFMPSVIWDRFSVAISSGGAGRTAIWHVGYEAFKKFWLLGAGVGNFPLAYDRAYLLVFSHYEHWSRGSHNLLVATSVELGTIGLVVMFLAWAGQFALLNQIPRSSPFYTYRIMAQAALLGLLAAAMFLDIMYTKYTWLTFTVATVTYLVWKLEQRQLLANRSTGVDPRLIQLTPVPSRALGTFAGR